MTQFLQISVNDFKLIFREPSLRTFIFMPVLILGIVNFFFPWLLVQFPAFINYLPVVMMGASTQASTMYGFIYGIVFLEEKDTEVARIYSILPINRVRFVMGRLAFPVIFSSITTFIVWITQPFYDLSILQFMGISLFFGLVAPAIGLLVGILASNKMEGMNWFKILNMVVTIPLVSFFIPAYADLFGILPHYWGFKSILQFIEGGNGWISLSIGFVFMGAILYLLFKWFARIHFSKG